MRKRKHRLIFVITIIAILICGVNCYAKEAEGFIDVKVEAPEDFEHSIMINLISNDGSNYLVVAEKENQWKANTKIPIGEYITEYVSFEKADSKYEIVYSENITIHSNEGTAFFISVNKTTEKEGSSFKAKEDVKDQINQEKEIKRDKSFTERLKGLLFNILKKNYISLVIIVVILIILDKSRRKKKKYDDYR